MLGHTFKKPRVSSKALRCALFSVFGNVVKHGLSCLIYYLKAKVVMHNHSRASKQSFRHKRLKTVSWGSSKEKIITSFKFEVDQKLIPDQNYPTLYNDEELMCSNIFRETRVSLMF